MRSFIKETSAEEFLQQRAVSGMLESEIPLVGQIYRKFDAANFPITEKILFGASRGQVAMTVSVTNAGKTTFCLNMVLTLAAGGEFPPLATRPEKPRRIIFIDGENTKGELQDDLRVMMRDFLPMERLLVEDNLLLVCDEFIDDKQLTLDNQFHFEAIRQRALDFKPDLIVIDTVAALYLLKNENDNAEIARVVMRPLKALASQVGSAIWLMHHCGKKSEDSGSASGALSGRGGSNFGSLARSVIKLTAPDKTDKTRVVLSVEKSKGYRVDDLVLRLDRESRWFRVTDETPPVQMTLKDEIVELVTREMTTVEIAGACAFFARRTVEDALRVLVSSGKLNRIRKGIYGPLLSARSTLPIEDCGSGETDSDTDASTVQPPEDMGLPL